jgi:hypothetical protein
MDIQAETKLALIDLTKQRSHVETKLADCVRGLLAFGQIASTVLSCIGPHAYHNHRQLSGRIELPADA